MADDDHGAVFPVRQRLQRGDDILATLAIERGGRLIGKDQAGLARQCPRNGHALFLATRQFGGKMIGAIAHVEALEQLQRRRLLLAWRKLLEIERDGDVFPGAQGRKQVVMLEDEADMGKAQGRQGFGIERMQRLSVQGDTPLAWPQQAAHHLQQGGLARAARTEQQGHLAGAHVERDVAQRRQGSRALAIGDADILDAQQGFAHANTLLGSMRTRRRIEISAPNAHISTVSAASTTSSHHGTITATLP